MKFEIKNRWTGAVQFECELSAEVAGTNVGARIGFAVKRAYESDADLRGADLRGADLRGVPVIPDIHQQVYAAASRDGALDMATWHTCETTHCRAGWVVTLAGDAGRAMEWCMGTPAAASLIYMASDPKLEKVPDFYASNEAALADMKRLAEAATTET